MNGKCSADNGADNLHKKELHTDKDLDCSSDLLRRIVDSDFAPAWDAKAKSIIEDGLIYFILVLVKW